HGAGQPTARPLRHPQAPRRPGRSAPADSRPGGPGVGVMGTLRRLFRNETNYNFVRAWRYGLALSAAAVLISLLSFGLRGLELGIDFVGGTAWDVPSSELSVAETRDVL